VCTDGAGIDRTMWTESTGCVLPPYCDVVDWFRPPVCASTCADFATSEETIVMTPEFCGGNSSNLTDLRINLVRADFTVCALPSNSLRFTPQPVQVLMPVPRVSTDW